MVQALTGQLKGSFCQLSMTGGPVKSEFVILCFLSDPKAWGELGGSGFSMFDGCFRY